MTPAEKEESQARRLLICMCAFGDLVQFDAQFTLVIDPAQHNVDGGAIAIDHPFSLTGAHWQAGRRARQVVVSMCVKDGMGAAGLFGVFS